MLDIRLFRDHPDVVRRSQEARGADPEVVDQLLSMDKEHLALTDEINALRAKKNTMAKSIGNIMKDKSKSPEEKKAAREQAKVDTQALAKELAAAEAKFAEIDAAITNILVNTGNIIPEDQNVPIAMDEKDNAVVWKREPSPELVAAQPKLYNHVRLMNAIDCLDVDAGNKVAGGRGYFMKGDLVVLNQALISFALKFLREREFTPVQTPFFMTKDVMARCAQLSDFDEQLYKVSGEGEDKYLIATSEQPLCGMHLDTTMRKYPVRYAGVSTCFRKEAGRHGEDTSGLFRIHQFEKVEQFIVTSPDKSWEELENMITNSREFFDALEIPYEVVAIVSGALNNAAAKKYDLEGYFPASGAYRELVSCSNCTDYQARRLTVFDGDTAFDAEGKRLPRTFAHMLNGTMCATQRTLCCIVENYQTEKGIRIPKVLQPYTGFDFIPFVIDPADVMIAADKAAVKKSKKQK